MKKKEASPMHTLLTPWGEKTDREHPWPEYPRPQLRRDNWLCLNGIWEYAITAGRIRPACFDGDIVVPFSPESALSGVNRQLQPGQTLWYRRKISFPPLADGRRLLLHFGAVDQHCRVWLNDVPLGSHDGGYWPFTFDITRAVRPDENELILAVTDDSDAGTEAWGKQRQKRGGIWYTGQSGIWQTVWCEEVPAVCIERLRITPQWRENAVEIEVFLDDGSEKRMTAPAGSPLIEPAAASAIHTSAVTTVTVQVLDGDVIAAEETADVCETDSSSFAPDCSSQSRQANHVALRLSIPDVKSWSPDDPFLYTLRITAGEDHADSYFGMREFSTAADRDGHLRPTLNGKPIFHTGLLDQGYWSDGLYTPPSDEAMVHELMTLKKLGFNMLRKHIKIEPLRWYYHCDRLGILVWQDFVSGGGPYSPMVTQVLPFLNVRLSDSRYALFGRADKKNRSYFWRDMKRTVELLYNAVSINVWVPFNEGWGQFDAVKTENKLRAMDSTRLVDHASGWHDQGGGDFASYHIYYKHFHPKKDTKGRILALTEFGGFSHPTAGHMASDVLFGYKIFETQEKLEQEVMRLYEEDVFPLLKDGLSASIYTQVSDVEDEINGLFTYDRRRLKFSETVWQTINQRLKSSVD